MSQQENEIQEEDIDKKSVEVKEATNMLNDQAGQSNSRKNSMEIP